MNLFPFVPKEIIQIKEDILPLYKEVAWDFDKDIPIIENGNLKIVTENDAIKVWIYKSILTRRFKHLIYTWDYGCEAYSLIGKSYNKPLTEAEVKRYIKEALYINPYIKEIIFKEILFNEGKLTTRFTVTTIYSELEVVIINGKYV